MKQQLELAHIVLLHCAVRLHDGTWCQRCYDPDCRGYASPSMPLPVRVGMQEYDWHNA